MAKKVFMVLEFRSVEIYDRPEYISGDDPAEEHVDLRCPIRTKTVVEKHIEEIEFECFDGAVVINGVYDSFSFYAEAWKIIDDLGRENLFDVCFKIVEEDGAVRYERPAPRELKPFTVEGLEYKFPLRAEKKVSMSRTEICWCPIIRVMKGTYELWQGDVQTLPWGINSEVRFTVKGDLTL
ncbi:MAG: hypothetical protein V1807_01045 [Patescibacteria group bacterium]